MIGAHWGMLSVGRSCVSGRSAGVRFAVGSPKILLAVEIFGRVLVRMFSTLLCSGSNAVFGHSAGFVFSFSCSRSRCSSANSLCPFPLLVGLIKRLDRVGVRMALIHRSLEAVILACRFLPRELLGGRRHLLLRSGFLFRSRLRFYPVRTVKAGAGGVHLLVHRAIDIGVMNHAGVHVRHGGVVTEAVSFPSAAPVAVSGIAIAVVNAAVKTDSRAPVAVIKSIKTVAPAPPGRGPKQTYYRRRNPGAGDPIVIADTPSPVTGSPDIARDRNRRLHLYRQNRRSKIDRYTYLRERGGQRQCDK